MKPYAPPPRPARSPRHCGATRTTSRAARRPGHRRRRAAGSRSPGRLRTPRPGGLLEDRLRPDHRRLQVVADDPQRVAALDADLVALATRFDRGTDTTVLDWEYLILTARIRADTRCTPTSGPARARSATRSDAHHRPPRRRRRRRDRRLGRPRGTATRCGRLQPVLNVVGPTSNDESGQPGALATPMVSMFQRHDSIYSNALLTPASTAAPTNRTDPAPAGATLVGPAGVAARCPRGRPGAVCPAHRRRVTRPTPHRGPRGCASWGPTTTWA